MITLHTIAISVALAHYFSFYGCIIIFVGYFSDKQYASADEEDSRKDAFIANHKSITIHNYLHAKGLSTYTMGINQYTDMVRL